VLESDFPNPGYTLSGTVSSSDPRCVGGRTVELQRDADVIATTTTDPGGNWTFGHGVLNYGDTHFVNEKVLKKNKKHKHVCNKTFNNSYVQ
jgi:hypothetical protein